MVRKVAHIFPLCGAVMLSARRKREVLAEVSALVLSEEFWARFSSARAKLPP